MANGKDDIRVALGWPRHYKRRALQRELGPAGPLALLDLWCFAGEHRPDGVFKSADEVEVAVEWPKRQRGRLVAALIATGWLEADGVTLHDWHDEQPWIANRPARVAAARANGAAGGRAKAAKAQPSATDPGTNPPTGTASGIVADSYRNGSKVLPPTPSPSPSPSPSPTPTPSPVPTPTRARPPEPGASPPPEADPDADPSAADDPVEGRARGTDAVAALLATQAGAPPGFARTIATEAVERVEGDHAYLVRHLGEHPLPRGADLGAWKRRTVKAWVEERDATRLAASQRANAQRLAEVAEQDRLRAEFEASGYTDAAAWRSDRKAGQLRTGEAAARRRWVLGRGAFDDEGDGQVEPVRVVGCPTSSSARGLTCRKPRASRVETGAQP